MYKIILGALTGALIASQATSCEENPHNYSRINPTELTCQQEAWLNTNRPDESNGRLGSLFWVKIDGIGYVSTPISELVKKGNKKANEMVKELIITKAKEIEGRIADQQRDDLFNLLQHTRSEILQLQTAMIIDPQDSTLTELLSLIQIESELTATLFQ